MYTCMYPSNHTYVNNIIFNLISTSIYIYIYIYISNAPQSGDPATALGLMERNPKLLKTK